MKIHRHIIYCPKGETHFDETKGQRSHICSTVSLRPSVLLALHLLSKANPRSSDHGMEEGNWATCLGCLLSPTTRGLGAKMCQSVTVSPAEESGQSCWGDGAPRISTNPSTKLALDHLAGSMCCWGRGIRVKMESCALDFRSISDRASNRTTTGI